MKRVVLRVVLIKHPGELFAWAACGVLVFVAHSMWPMVAWLIAALGADFDRGWNREADPIPVGMIRLTFSDAPPVCIPPTPELLKEMARIVAIAKGQS